MKMKRTRIIAGLIVLSMIALASFASLAKADVVYVPSGIQVSGNGNTWQFDTQGVFSGKEVESVKAVYWIGTTEHTVVQKNTVLNDNKVQLVFDSNDLIQGITVDGTRIEGVLSNGDTFLVSGPGWAFRQG